MIYQHECKRLHNFITRAYYEHGNQYNKPEWTGYRDNDNDNIHAALLDQGYSREPKVLYYKASEIYG